MSLSTSPVDNLIKGLIDEIDDLVKEYNEKNRTWDQVERERYQKRTSAKVCDLLVDAEDLLKDKVKDYDILKKFFCRMSNKLQNSPTAP
jgi:hypothetical protein